VKRRRRGAKSPGGRRVRLGDDDGQPQTGLDDSAADTSDSNSERGEGPNVDGDDASDDERAPSLRRQQRLGGSDDEGAEGGRRARLTWTAEADADMLAAAVVLLSRDPLVTSLALARADLVAMAQALFPDRAEGACPCICAPVCSCVRVLADVGSESARVQRRYAQLRRAASASADLLAHARLLARLRHGDPSANAALSLPAWSGPPDLDVTRPASLLAEVRRWRDYARCAPELVGHHAMMRVPPVTVDLGGTAWTGATPMSLRPRRQWTRPCAFLPHGRRQSNCSAPCVSSRRTTRALRVTAMRGAPSCSWARGGWSM
jgi:hypothetical protein